MEIGSKVRFLNMEGEGVITGMDGDRYVVMDVDGMDAAYPASELVEVKMGSIYEKHLVGRSVDRQHKKLQAKTSVKTPSKTVRKNAKCIEVDLHQESLCPNRSGMSSVDIHELQLKTIRTTLDRERSHHGMQIIFIHGQGDGILRNELRSELSRRSSYCSFEDAMFSKYGFHGATKVYIK